MKRLANEWNSFLTTVIPNDAPPIQREECRRAFYAGAWSLFCIVMNMLDPGTEPTANDLVKMDELKKELDDYVQSLVKQTGA